MLLVESVDVVDASRMMARLAAPAGGNGPPIPSMACRC